MAGLAAHGLWVVAVVVQVVLVSAQVTGRTLLQTQVRVALGLSALLLEVASKEPKVAQI